MKINRLIRRISKIPIYYFFLPCVALLSLVGIIIEGQSSYWLGSRGGSYLYEYEYKNLYKELVPPYVDKYEADSCFIVARQYPKGKYYFKRVINNADITYPDGFYSPYYWIVNKVDTAVYGPYNYQEFICKCDSLNVRIKFEERK